METQSDDALCSVSISWSIEGATIAGRSVVSSSSPKWLFIKLKVTRSKKVSFSGLLLDSSSMLNSTGFIDVHSFSFF